MSRIAIASKKSIYPPLTIAKCEILFPQSVLYWGHDSFIKLYFVSPPHSWRSLNWKTPSATSPILLIISSSTCSGLSPKKSDPLSDRHFRKLLQNNIYVSSDRQMSGLKLYPRYLNWKCFYVVSHQSWVPHFFERKQKESFAISEHVRTCYSSYLTVSLVSSEIQNISTLLPSSALSCREICLQLNVSLVHHRMLNFFSVLFNFNNFYFNWFILVFLFYLFMLFRWFFVPFYFMYFFLSQISFTHIV